MNKCGSEKRVVDKG